MFLIVEELLTKTIEDKLAYLRATPAEIDQIFAGASEATRNNIKKYVTDNAIRVVRGFPRDPAVLPVYAIVLGAENEQVASLGSSIGDDDETSEEMYGVMTNVQYRIEVWSNNGDLTVHLYHLLKWIVLSSRDDLQKEGLINQTVGGADLEPVPLQLPELVYRRALSLSGMYEARWTVPYGRITTININPEWEG